MRKRRLRKSWLLGAAVMTASGCLGAPEPNPVAKGPAPVDRATTTDILLASLTPAKLLPTTDQQKQVDAALDEHFHRSPSRRAYIMTDKPLYQPGEAVWFRTEIRQAATLTAAPLPGMTAQLVSPRGAQVAQKRIQVTNGWAANDFEIPADVEGGEYVLQITADDGTVDKRKIIISTYEAPRLKKELEFVRKAYGAGDQVSAAVEVHRATGEAYANKALTGVVTLDDAEIQRVAITTDADGKAIVHFALPAAIGKGDGLLTILADDGGVTESIQKRIPILMKTLSVSVFPEGGDLVEGLPGRVYFSALNALGKPADVEGRVVDDEGTQVATFKSVHDGMGRFELTPGAGRSYHVEITRPAGIDGKFFIPNAHATGCVLRAVESNEPHAGNLEVAACCSEPHSILVEAALREQRIAGGTVDVTAHKPALIDIPVDDAAQGAVRVTLFDEHKDPLAERIIYHGRGKDLKVAITSNKKTYSPRDPVTLTVKTTDLAGKPVAANLGLAVVDDTVLSFADDKSGQILAHTYLEPELGTDPIEEPNFYFSDKPEAAAAMDALVATRGWRRFDWQLVFNPPPPPPPVAIYYDGLDEDRAGNVMAVAEGEMPAEAAPAPERMERARAPMKAAAKPMAAPAQPVAVATPPADAATKVALPRNPVARNVDGPAAHEAWGKKDLALNQGAAGRGVAMRHIRGGDDFREAKEKQGMAWAPVRVFPAPTYKAGYDGPRDDFRETIFWAPNVATAADGTAQVTFYVSDAVTSFRAVAEGTSAGGLPGRGEAEVQSKMPMSLDVHLPLEVSQGDLISLPVTLTNETDRSLDADLTTDFGPAFALQDNPLAGKVALAAGEKKTYYFPLKVIGKGGDGDVSMRLHTAGWIDEMAKMIRVVPLGFPFEVAASGTLHGSARHEFSLEGEIPGSAHATITMYPSPLATMTQGMQGMIREPGGCFEQTSSSNYPNVMIMSYLGANDAADPALVQKTQTVLEHGYKLLTGYETPEKGYEWFGHTPGHEALTAYGLMEFEDMSKVYDVDHSMVERTAAWLMTRRDGKGGFNRSSEALDSFGRAGGETTNAYIMWALAEAKRAKGMDPELAVQRKEALESKDPYLTALAVNTLLLTDPTGADTAAAVKRLVGMQAKDGSFPGAKETITMSGGNALTVETTALATLSLVKASPNGEQEAALRGGVEWLNAHRGGFGEWGNTQATVLSLKTLTAYADHSRQTQTSGTATVLVNGKAAGSIHFEKGRKDALVFDDLDALLVAGDNSIELKMDGEAQLPYTVSVEYRADRPQSNAETKVAVATTMNKSSVKMGEGVRLRAHVENRDANGIPMTLARVGIPGGLTFQTWQLKELRDKGIIDFYETRPREVILYWRAMAPKAIKDVDLDLLAAVPGTYVAPASSAYLYYTAEDKAWNDPLRISVER